MKGYEEAANSHDFDRIRPLIASDAVYFFSNKSLFGIEEIEQAFLTNFRDIQDETYSIENVRWLALSDTAAICVYDFHWSGLINGERRRGGGRGTNGLARRDDRWVIVHEHLSTIRN